MTAGEAGLQPSAGAVDVQIRGVDLSYGSNRVLKDVNLQIRAGEFFAFLGPSGCGKTTLLRLIAGFNRADRGEVRVGGQDISGLPPWKRQVGMVFQSYALWPHMSVARNVAFGLEERRLPRAEVERRVAAALALVGLSDFSGRMPAQLSGGQQQRVALARTIAVEPRVLLLDEPLSNLDAKMRVQVRRELRDLQRRLGLTTIFVTHDQEEANAICDRIAIMRDGVIQQVGTPRELYERPANLFVATFLGSANVLGGRLERQGDRRVFVVGEGAALTVPPGAIVPEGARLVTRPQALALTPDPEPGTVPGALVHAEFLGASIRYLVRVGGDDIAVDAPFRPGEPVLVPGGPVHVRVPLDHALWLAA